MHTTTQNLAHRATLARTKPRWQPYASTPSQILHMKTPAIAPSPLPTSPQPAQNAANVPPNAPQSLPSAITTPSHQQTQTKEPRDSNKNKFAAGLIDQAVKLLTEVWRPDVIPQAFRPPRPSPSANPTSGPTESIGKQRQNQAAGQSPSTSSADIDSDGPLLPIRPFIHEVLRRSRTSATVLQTALCYLEAVRPKIPEIASLERSGVRYAFEPETRIMPATEAELAREAELAKLEADSTLASLNETTLDTTMSDFVGTVKATDEDHLDTDSSASDSSSMFTGASTHTTTATSVSPTGSISNAARPMKPTTDAPSPLLCPRRAFLSAIILASKFSQDKSYSNRAWAKLSGLPAREVGRCERALGQALEWRLWVGKKSTAEATPSPPVVKPVVRARTEGSISCGPIASARGPFLTSQDLGPTGPCSSLTTSAKIQLRKSGTLPASSFKFGVNVTMVPPKTMPSGRHGAHTPSFVHDAASGAMPTPQAAPIPHLDAYAPGAMASSAATYTQSPESYTGLSGPGSSPGTPGLSYSPSCTEVSSGSQTVFVASLEDDMLTSYNPSQPWSNSVDASFITSKHSLNTQSKGDSVQSANANRIKIVFTEDNNPFVPVWGRDSGSVAVGTLSAF